MSAASLKIKAVGLDFGPVEKAIVSSESQEEFENSAAPNFTKDDYLAFNKGVFFVVDGVKANDKIANGLMFVSSVSRSLQKGVFVYDEGIVVSPEVMFMLEAMGGVSGIDIDTGEVVSSYDKARDSVCGDSIVSYKAGPIIVIAAKVSVKTAIYLSRVGRSVFVADTSAPKVSGIFSIDDYSLESIRRSVGAIDDADVADDFRRILSQEVS